MIVDIVKRGAIGAALVALASPTLPAAAQTPALAPTNPIVGCPNPPSQPLILPPEIVRDAQTNVLSGTIILSEEFQRFPTSTKGKTVTCAPQLVRMFRADPSPPTPAAKPQAQGMNDPIPGPTLRARVGDLVQLRFINEVNSNRFDRNIDIDACTTVGPGGSIYPAGVADVAPNCLHASSTANIHFHGTHTNPNSTGDNVFLQIRPLPRDNQGNLTTTPQQAMVGFDEFFKTCADQIKQKPLYEWPMTWKDMPQDWVKEQSELLMAYERQNPSQPLWTIDRTQLVDGWPQYYIGAVPYCYALPQYTAQVFPPPPNSGSPIMGQAPGTHWYHAHKHGSTAINVANGMVGAFVIEGEYDDEINTAYGKFMLKDNKPWNTRGQPVLVLNQLYTTYNLLTGGGGPAGPAGIDFTINGRLRPIVEMQPGEVQLWRIVNASARNAAYFMAPEGFAWRQLAQDGVQFANTNYQTPNNENRPFYLAPGNRVDLLVQAPMVEIKADVLVQGVMGRSQVKPTPTNPTLTDPKPGVPLMSVNVAGPPVTLSGQAMQMPFLNRAPKQPLFLGNVSDDELRQNAYAHKKLVFNSGTAPPTVPGQQTINGIQFHEGDTNVWVMLNRAEEWKIENTTAPQVGAGVIDHPFHIHVNPFQITEVFDPNENVVDETTGQLVGQLVNGKTVPLKRYVTQKTPNMDPRQCFLDPDDPDTWKPCHPAGPQTNLIWWDVFAIPSGRLAPTKTNPNNVVPGYFKMRSRFVDYPGFYVLHCHILPHEDRGMMFTVEVIKPRPIPVQHH
jgi:FtsP/CotA-like multicopper oxidase with cupredoxin domain